MPSPTSGRSPSPATKPSRKLYAGVDFSGVEEYVHSRPARAGRLLRIFCRKSVFSAHLCFIVLLTFAKSASIMGKKCDFF